MMEILPVQKSQSLPDNSVSPNVLFVLFVVVCFQNRFSCEFLP